MFSHPEKMFIFIVVLVAVFVVLTELELSWALHWEMLSVRLSKERLLVGTLALRYTSTLPVRTTLQTTNTIPDKDRNLNSGVRKFQGDPSLLKSRIADDCLTRTTHMFVSVMLFWSLVWCNERKINDTEAPFDPSLPDWCSQWHSHIHILCPSSPTSLSLSTCSFTSNKHPIQLLFPCVETQIFT